MTGKLFVLRQTQYNPELAEGLIFCFFDCIQKSLDAPKDSIIEVQDAKYEKTAHVSGIRPHNKAGL